MPKLTRNFLKGRLNRDIDARLIPPGEYRDATNIQIATSEGADVGAIESILGNVEQNAHPVSGSWQAKFGGLNTKVIGSARDTQKNKIYWFITCPDNDIDAIVEYNIADSKVSPIIIDARDGTNGVNPVLNFSTDNIITGINIVDGMLFWTDNLNEPRRLNVETFKTAALATVGNATTFVGKTTSVYERPEEVPGEDTTRLFTAHDITVIKKGPETALTIKVGSSVKSTSSSLNPAGTAVNPVTTSFNFSDVANNAVVSPGDTSVGAFTLSSAIGYYDDNPERVVVLNASKTQADKTISKYRVVANIDRAFGSASSTSVKLDIQQMSNDIPNETLSWEFKLLEDDAVFENDMPRFSYRYKYVDGEYSPFAPFSKAAFAPGKFKYSSEEGLNSGMENNIRQIYLTGFSQSDMDVEKVEVLCKTTKSENVYVIHELSATSTTSSLTLLTDKLGRVVPSNQSLRLFDAVPRKALAQEVVGNRLVYGNYLENYDLTTSDGRVSATQSNTATASDPIGTPSVKSGRDYTIGISWLDEFGRESPVLTSSDSSILIKRKQAAKINKLRASIDIQSYTAPSWATHYKWYIKESRGEYYNLALDRYYNAEDGSVWLSFPSSEINKVREGQHIFLKKEHDSSTPILEDNKFKILNIEKSAPEYLINKYTPIASSILASDNGAANTFGSGFILGENKITFYGPTSDTAQPDNDEIINIKFFSAIKQGAVIEFRSDKGYGASAKYKIKNGGPTGSVETNINFEGQHHDWAKYEIILENPIEDQWLVDLDDHAILTGFISHKEARNFPEFNGRFFINVAKTAVLQDKIKAAFTEINDLEENTSFIISASNETVSGGEVPENTTHILWKDNDGDASSGSGQTNEAIPFNSAATIEDTFRLFFVDSSGTSAALPNEKTVKFLDKFVPGVYFKFKYGGTVGSGTYRLLSKTAGSQYNRAATTDGQDTNNEGHGTPYTFVMDKYWEDDQALWTGGGVIRITGIQILKEVDKPDIDQLTSTNPAVFETEPLDIADVDLFYEASGKIAKGNITSVADIDWFNCYTFGNGVESNRIRDDFNAPVIGNGVRVNAKLDEPFKETRRGSSMTFGGIINNITNVNNSNQFLTAEDIFKDLNPSYGTIQKLHARNSDLIALCADKVIKILANKDALFEADGRPALTATPNVLGQAVPFAGEYGISNNPESFASYGFRAYFADKARRAVLRLSADGLTVISDKGMRNHFSDRWDAFGNNKIYGSFDERNEVYNVTTRVSPAEQVSFNEAANGWTTRLTYVSEFSGLSLDNQYYTFHEGKIWKHSSANRNNFYDVGYNSSIKVIFNDAPDKVKRFTALSYDGGNGWDAEITTSGQTGVVNEWKNKEGLYYNFIKGSSITTTSDFSVQGIGKPSVVSNDATITFQNPINVSVQIGDGVYKNAIISAQGTITDISSDRLQLTTGSTISVLTSDFIYVKKPVGTFVSALTGTTATVSMTKAGGNGANNELFSVSAEAFISSE